MSSCEKNGGKDQILKLHENDWDRDYKKARRMASWTSTHAMLVSVTFVYYFAGKVLATKPDKTGQMEGLNKKYLGILIIIMKY